MEELENLHYLAPNPEELFKNAPKDIQDLIVGDDVNTATAVLGKAYKLPISLYIALENVISFILIGALRPEDVVRGIMDILDLPEDKAYKLAEDLDKTILEKARIKIFNKKPTDMVELSFGEGRSPTELRKEIMDTSKLGPLQTKATEGEPKIWEQRKDTPAQPVTKEEVVIINPVRPVEHSIARFIHQPEQVKEVEVKVETPQIISQTPPETAPVQTVVPVVNPPIIETKPTSVEPVVTTPPVQVSPEPRLQPLQTTEVPVISPQPINPPAPQPIQPKKEDIGPPVEAGSRTQLLEQLKILDSIPTDEEVAERLAKIQEQIATMKAKEQGSHPTIPLEELVPKGGQVIVQPTVKAASYSKAPTRYNVDPYREVSA